MRTSPHPLYPVFLELSGTPVLVVGGGEVALRKVGTLLECGAHVTVISPEIHADLAALVKRKAGSARVLRRKFRTSDLSRRWRMVVAATHHAEFNARIGAACRRKGIWVNVVSPPDAGDVQIPSAIRHGRFCVAFSTGGSSAALAATVRGHVEKTLGPEWGVLCDILSARREKIQRSIADPSKRSALLQKLGGRRWVLAVKRHGRKKAEQLIDREIGRCVQ
ncbi:MAG TPA: bifunctional precorrin-2 dehydrogenase/sirohydrochlorin ferrochelatase [Planctomycetota bacterium]|nr:bifunctional precorrin-2 dehydrogenase/sirohydrochlorin ferrochelatase [Planctomycetota bacterium]